MMLSPGARLGPYEIVSPLGAGGMGEVYRARDTRLDRVVAIKVLPPALAADPQFRDRFHQEARAISALEHPHICPLYDVGEQDGTSFLVMQYLEGETLEARLSKGALPIDQALQYATQIASALDRAHRAGIVHRDLKPGNVMLTPGGARLLDFGLAKSAPALAAPSLSVLPTTPPALTAQGTILGTFQYMAPEQLEGREADARTDIFAFGAVLHEMVTGRRVFASTSQAGLIAAIMHLDAPPLALAPGAVPRGLERVVKKCLAKDPADRWQSAKDLLDVLEWTAVAADAETPAAPARSRPRPGWLVLAAGVTVIAAGVAVGVAFQRLSPQASEANRNEFTVTAPSGAPFPGLLATIPFHLAVSPDGRYLAFLTQPGLAPGSVLWIRPTGSVEARRIDGSEGASYPFWSPDSRSVAFFAGGKLKKVDVDGGQPITLSDAQSANGGAWGPDGTIVFTRIGSDPVLYRVPASGGDLVPIAIGEVAGRKLAYVRWPQFLPDGRQLIVQSGPPDTLYAVPLEGGTPTPLVKADTAGMFAAGHLVYQRQSVLYAQPFDPGRLEMTGEPLALASGLQVGPGARSAFSVRDERLLAYRREGVGDTELRWVDRRGTVVGTVSSPGLHINPALSADGLRVAVGRTDAARQAWDVWVLDLTRTVWSRFTFDAGSEWLPAWSPDGRWVAFTKDRGTSKHDVYRKLSNNAGADELIFESAATKGVSGWTPDGRAIVFHDTSDSGGDINYVAVTGDRKPVSYLKTEFHERNGRVSGDGRWMAYESDESGRFEVYVRPFPDAQGGKWQLSSDGGTDPRWRADGRELYYFSGDNTLTAVPVQPAGPELATGAPQPLFRASRTGNLTNYAVTPDGQRFLVNTVPESQPTSGITVVVNWLAAPRD